MPVPPPSDLLATISMFEQIKAEPIGFYSACPPTQSSQSMSSRSGTSGDSSQQQQQQQQSVITSSNNEDNKDVVLQQSLASVSGSLLYIVTHTNFDFTFPHLRHPHPVAVAALPCP